MNVVRLSLAPAGDSAPPPLLPPTTSALISAALLAMRNFLAELRCDQPTRRAALHVVEALDMLSERTDLPAAVREQLAELADAWEPWVAAPWIRPGPHRSFTAGRGVSPVLRLINGSAG